MAGDVDYERAGRGYAVHRRADARIARVVHDALGDARTVVNVGAGNGSYEPRDRRVVAVEPSSVMRDQRSTPAPAVAAFAEALPFRDDAFDAAMATVTVHQWSDLPAGLAEMRRVSRGSVVVLTFDPASLDRSWLHEYAPEVVAIEQRRMPPVTEVVAMLGGESHVMAVPIPADCTDGFGEAYFARPERMLDPAVRRAQSAWRFVGPEGEARFVDRLSLALASGEWDERYGHLRTLDAYEGSLRLVWSGPRQPAAGA